MLKRSFSTKIVLKIMIFKTTHTSDIMRDEEVLVSGTKPNCPKNPTSIFGPKRTPRVSPRVYHIVQWVVIRMLHRPACI